jgi:hypothetical protein
VTDRRLRDDERGASAVVSKTLELALVTLFVTGLAVTLFGGVVPDYRTGAGDAVADRTAVAAAQGIESATPPDVRRAHRVVPVDLPETIRGAAYRVRASNGSLVLDHPNPAVGATVPLDLPPGATVNGTWESGARTVAVGERAGGRLRFRLAEHDGTEGAA